MAQVPYTPFSTATPISPGERVQENTPGEAFGVNIGNALEHLGTTGEQVGSELYQRATALQELQNETMAREQAVKTTQTMAMRYEEFKKLGERMSEPGQLKAFYDDIEKMRVDGRNQLPNAHAQRFFDAEAANLQNRVTMASAASAGDAFKARTLGAAKAQLSQASNAWVDPLDAKEVQSKIDNVHGALDTAQGINGWTDSRRKVEEQVAISDIRLGQLHAISQNNPQKSLELLDDPKWMKEAGMTDSDAQKAKDFAFSQNRTIGAQFLANKVYAPEKSLKDMETEVRALAPQYAHGDGQFEAHAISAIRNHEFIERNAEVRGFATAKSIVDEAINTGYYTTVQQMKQDPRLATAIESMKPSDQNKLQNDITSFLKHRDAVINDKNYSDLWTLSQTKPMEFLNADIWKDPMSIPQRKDLINLRKKIIKDGGGAAIDPQVQKAAQFIRNEYPHSIPQDIHSEGYRTFLGTLQGAMMSMQEAKGGKLTAEDYSKLGKSIIEEIPKSGFFHNYQIFNAPVPDIVMDHGKAEGKTEDEITYNYRAARAMETYQRLFGGTAKPTAK